MHYFHCKEVSKQCVQASGAKAKILVSCNNFYSCRSLLKGWSYETDPFWPPSCSVKKHHQTEARTRKYAQPSA